MAAQMYMVALKGEFSQEASRDVQRRVRNLGGLILMVTRNGPIVMLDDRQAPQLASHPSVRMVGGVALNPNGMAAERLKRIFAQNVSKQLFVARKDGSPIAGSEEQRSGT